MQVLRLGAGSCLQALKVCTFMVADSPATANADWAYLPVTNICYVGLPGLAMMLRGPGPSLAIMFWGMCSVFGCLHPLQMESHKLGDTLIGAMVGENSYSEGTARPAFGSQLQACPQRRAIIGIGLLPTNLQPNLDPNLSFQKAHFAHSLFMLFKIFLQEAATSEGKPKIRPLAQDKLHFPGPAWQETTLAKSWGPGSGKFWHPNMGAQGSAERPYSR